MCSYAHKPSKNLLNLIKSYPDTVVMLDSGAFSAYNSGQVIDIDKYIQFIKDNEIDLYFNLDVIGNVEGTVANQHYMESQGLNPIPVYHYGETLEYLDYLVEQGYSYIGLGGTVGKSVKQRQEFFDEVFARHPNIDYHGLGVTAKALVESYNWYSCDSTTWLNPFKNKAVIGMDGKARKHEELDQWERFEACMPYFNWLNNLDRQ